MADRLPSGPWLSPPINRTVPRSEVRSPTLSLGSSLTLGSSLALGSTLSLPLCSERSSSSSRASSRNSSTSSSSWSSQWSWNTFLSNASFNEALMPQECILPCRLSKGLVQGRDGGRGGAGYMNLPSPNVAAEDNEPSLFRGEGEASDSDNGEEPGPPASALTRRRALVPPKLLTDTSNYDPQEHDSPTAINGCTDSSIARNKRRSSIVVIPPMQICPGDLLVYSKVLTQRTNLLAGELDGSTQSLAVTDAGDKSAASSSARSFSSSDTYSSLHSNPVGTRKGKNTWSLLRLFDRSSRTKSESLCGLEEVLSCLQPSEFEDEQLSRFKGMCWNDFVSFMEGGQQGDADSPTSTESQDMPLLRAETNPPLVALNDRALLITPSKTESRYGPYSSSSSYSTAADRQSEKLDRLSALSCLERETPLPKKRHPMTIMRTMSERSLDRGRAGHLLSLLSERVHADRSSLKHYKSSSSSNSKGQNAATAAAAAAAAATAASAASSSTNTTFTAASTTTYTTTNIPTTSPSSTCANTSGAGVMSSVSEGISSGDSGALSGVERMLESARDNVQAALNKNETKRREAVWDLFQSECAFLYDHLMVLKNVYMEPLKKIQVDGYAMFAEPELLFGNLDELCCVTYAFCKEFINLLEQHQVPGGQLDTTNVLVKLFQKGSKATMLCQAYHRYALNYINALNYLETLRRQLEFCEFEKWCNRDPRCKKLQLTDLLVAPVQHIMKVPLILRDIEGRTEDPQERAVVREIIEAEEHSLRELDDKMKWLKNFERLLEIQRNIFWPPVSELDPKVYIPDFLKSAISRQPCERLIVSPRRQIILEGSLHMLDSNKPQEMYVILFDDMLLITRRKKGLHKKLSFQKSSLTENWPSSCSRGSTGGESALRYIVYKQPLSLDRFFIHDVTPHESAASKLEAAFVLVNLNRFQQIVAVYTFQAQTEQIKQTWLMKLRDTQDKWKRTLQNTVFRSQRLPSSATTPPKGLLREASLQRDFL